MTRENAAAKGRRYLTEGRVTILEVSNARTSAAVRGDGALWFCKWTAAGWECDCPARGRCSHLIAVGLVTVTVRNPGEAAAL